MHTILWDFGGRYSIFFQYITLYLVDGRGICISSFVKIFRKQSYIVRGNNCRHSSQPCHHRFCHHSSALHFCHDTCSKDPKSMDSKTEKENRKQRLGFRTLCMKDHGNLYEKTLCKGCVKGLRFGLEWFIVCIVKLFPCLKSYPQPDTQYKKIVRT